MILKFNSTNYRVQILVGFEFRSSSNFTWLSVDYDQLWITMSSKSWIVRIPIYLEFQPRSISDQFEFSPSSNSIIVRILGKFGFSCVQILAEFEFISIWIQIYFEFHINLNFNQFQIPSITKRTFLDYFEYWWISNSDRVRIPGKFEFRQNLNSGGVWIPLYFEFQRNMHSGRVQIPADS